MGFSKIANVSLTDQLVIQIEDMIISGELKVGDKLPPARELCEILGVSRPVISAAMVELSKLGFVEICPRQGVFVGDYLRRGTVETMATVMRYHRGVMKRDEIEALIQVRDVLERLCMKLVITVATEEQLKSLAPLVEAIYVQSPEEAAEAIFAFHHELAVISGNMLLPLIYYSFKPQSTYLWEVSCRLMGVEEHYEQKKQLYRMLLRRDSENVERLISDSIAHAAKQLQPLMQ